MLEGWRNSVGEANERCGLEVGSNQKFSFRYISYVMLVRNLSEAVQEALGYIIFRGAVQARVFFSPQLQAYRYEDSV